MKVILLCDVKGTGTKNQVVTVSDGYARNFLLPKRWAVESTPAAEKEIARKKAQEEKLEQERKAAATEQAKHLKNKVIKMSVKCGAQGRLYGSITAQEIAAALKEQHDVEIDKRKIDLPEPIRQVGDATVNVWLYAGITTPMIVRVSAIEK